VVEETDKIKRHIDNERQNLGRNLDEIEERFKDATDLKTHFDRNTGWFLGAAVAGGFLLSLALGRSSGTSRLSSANRRANVQEMSPSMSSHSGGFVSEHLDRVSETVNEIAAVLVALFSEKLRSIVADAVPGFREEYENIRERDSSPESRRAMG